MELGISPLDPEILPEYKVLIGEIKEVYHHLNPEPNSIWLEECIAYGKKRHTIGTGNSLVPKNFFKIYSLVRCQLTPN